MLGRRRSGGWPITPPVFPCITTSFRPTSRSSRPPELKRREERLEGALIALSPPGTRFGNALRHWVSLAIQNSRRAAMTYLYHEHSWPQLREVAKQKPVCVIPCGTTEQHGPHLPLATDFITASMISERAVQRVEPNA